MNTIKIDTFIELEEIFKQLREEEKTRDLFYRGMRDANWKLQSSLEREIIDNLKSKDITQETYETIKNKQLENFRGNLKGIIPEQFLLEDKREFDNELWAIGQHFDLKTPLLDWSRSFYVALFFAFHKPENSLEYRAIYKLDKRILVLREKITKHQYIVEPKYDHYKRITTQRGLFTYWGAWDYIDKSISDLERIGQERGFSNEVINEAKEAVFVKYEISNSLRNEIMDYLNHIGISYMTIFPDFKGAIDKTNLELTDLLNELKSPD